MPTPLVRGALTPAAGRPGIRLGNVFRQPILSGYVLSRGVHECRPGDNRILLVLAATQTMPSTPALTVMVNEAAPTLVKRVSLAYGGVGYMHVLLYRTLAPQKGLIPIYVEDTSSGGALGGVMTVDFCGVHQGTPLGTAAGGSSSSAAYAELSVAAAAGDVVLDGIFKHNGASQLWPEGSQVDLRGDSNFVRGSYRPATAGTNVLRWDFDADNEYVMLGVAVKPA